MATFVYSPAVRVRIDTIKQGILDVSEDLVDGALTRRQGAPSTFQFSLQNARRKYDGVFTPMDRIVVEMKRIRWVRVYSGYLNSVPMFTVWPRVITLTSTCTLKRLQQWYWDPNSAAATELFMKGITPGETGKSDGGVKEKTIDLLTQVAKWPKDSIHISQIPANWFEFARPIADEILRDIEVTNYYSNLGSGATVAGSSGAAEGVTSLPGAGVGTGSLPDHSGKISWFGGPGGGAYGAMELTGESGVSPTDQWYCAMRWPYKTPDNKPAPNADIGKARAWWKGKKILVHYPDKQTSVVLRAADWGPSKYTGKVIDVSKQALDALGAPTGATVQIAFAPQDSPLGLVRAGGSVAAQDQAMATMSTSGSWGNPGDASNMTTVKLDNGKSLTIHKKVANNFKGFCNELLANGYQMQVIGGYSPRKISGSSKWSNHAYGAAIDIDWFEYGNRFDNNIASKIGTGFKGNAWIIALARKYGLGWGGEWSGRKDTMHFEAIGSPSAARYDGAPVDLGVSDGTGSTADPGQVDPADVLFKAFYTTPIAPGDLAVGEALSGPRALMNDTPILPYVQNLMNASMRTFSSAPNGDFIAWFPDYFGIWGTAARMNVRSIELLDFTVDWSDDYLVTHQFVVGANVPTFNVATGEFTDPDIQSLPRMIASRGIASVDFPIILKALLGVEATEANTYAFRDFVLRRFGARPATEFSTQIWQRTNGGESEFFLALFLFMQNWTNQFAANVPMTFMPELYPGMLLTLPEYSFQAYTTEVTHRFRFGKGGGFSTEAKIAAPARTDAKSPHVFGLLPIASPTANAPIHEYTPGSGIRNAPANRNIPI